MALSEGNATANAQANEEEVGDDDDDNHYYDVSDESSFYGDEETRTALEQEVADYDPASYWSTQHLSLSLSAIAAANIATSSSQTAAIPPNHHNPKKPLYNPYENDASARQLAEPTTDFLSRLPPLTTPASKAGPWIYIANPYSALRPLSQNLGAFSTAGNRILESLSAEILALEKSLTGRPQLLLNRRLTQLRKTATEEILSVAKECHVKTGKWMLFPPPEEVNAVWQRVVEATATGQLGSSAKVATDGGVDNNALGPGPGPGGGRGRPRLVCVYTEDFDDEGDVVRVLKKLVEMGLVNRKEAGRQARGLYYKCDAFTHLGIDSTNEWGLKASLHASKDLLAAEKDKEKGKNGKGKGKGFKK